MWFTVRGKQSGCLVALVVKMTETKTFKTKLWQRQQTKVHLSSNQNCCFLFEPVLCLNALKWLLTHHCVEQLPCCFNGLPAPLSLAPVLLQCGCALWLGVDVFSRVRTPRDTNSVQLLLLQSHIVQLSIPSRSAAVFGLPLEYIKIMFFPRLQL